MEQQLSQIFINCNDLKSITFSPSSIYYYTINGNEILTVLDQTLPKNLNTIIYSFVCFVILKNTKRRTPLGLINLSILSIATAVFAAARKPSSGLQRDGSA